MSQSALFELGEAASDGLVRRDASLAEVLDRLLDTGVVIEGDLVLSIADVDLVWLGVRAVLGGARHAPPGSGIDHSRARLPVGALAPDRERERTSHPRRESDVGSRRTDKSPLPLDEEGLVRLVLSVADLLRQVMERQALRRVSEQELSDEQTERLGLALMRLSERMDEMKEHFGLADDDLELFSGVVLAEPEAALSQSSEKEGETRWHEKSAG